MAFRAPCPSDQTRSLGTYRITHFSLWLIMVTS
jgi:hypothetical protein